MAVERQGSHSESLADREQLVRQSTDEESSTSIQRLLDVRKRMAAATMGATGTKARDSADETLESLRQEEADLAREVSQILHRPESFGEWVDLQAIREALPDDGVLIDVARLDVYDFANPDPELTDERFQPPHYVAWIVPPDGSDDVRLVDLGLAAEIDAAVSDIRTLVEGRRRSWAA